MSVKVLIVEDDPVMMSFYKHHLKSLEKAELEECSCGADVIEILNRFEPDIVIMDYHLPDITGLELTSILVMKYPAVIVVAISGDDRKNLDVDMLEIGAVSFLKKPVNSRVLFLTLQNFVEIVLSRKERRAAFSAERGSKPESRPAEKKNNKTAAVADSEAAEMQGIDNRLLTSKAVPKSPAVFFKEIEAEYEYVDEFLDSADDVSYACDKLYDNMDARSLADMAAVLENAGRRLNSLQEFPIVSYSAAVIAENLNRMGYADIEPAPLKRLCVFVYDYSMLFLRWVKTVFKERATDDVHFMDFELIGFVMQMESIFYDKNVLSDNNEDAADEGGSIEFF